MKKLRITIGKKSYDVTVEVLSDDSTHSTRSIAPQAAPPPAAASKPASHVDSPSAASRPKAAGAVTSPMAGAVKSILVAEGDDVKEQQPLVILEAMKMENQITAPTAGTIKSVEVKEGDSVQEGHVLVVLD